MRTIVIAMAAAVVTMMNGTPAAAQEQPIENWVAQVNKRLDRNMVFPPNGEHGVAVVTFERGEDGRARAVQVQTGTRTLARAARQTLNRVRDLPLLPSGFAGKRIRLQMLVGNPDDVGSFYDKRSRMLADARTSNIQLAQAVKPVVLADAGVR